MVLKTGEESELRLFEVQIERGKNGGTKDEFSPQPRTILALPFYSSMLYIAFSFKGQAYKRIHTPVKI